jgi:hypothetical protein
MVFYLDLFVENNVFQHVSTVSILEPFMYLSRPESRPESCSHTPIPCGDPCAHPPPLVDVPIAIPADPLVSVPPTPPLLDKPPPTAGVSRREDRMPGIFPRKPDNLFWCVFITLYGYPEYHKIGHRYGNTEIEEKHEMMERMKQSPTTAKNVPKKMTKALLQETMSDFMTNKHMTLDMLTMYAVYHNLHFWILFLNSRGEPEPYYVEIAAKEPATRDFSQIVLLYKRGKHDVSLVVNPDPALLQDIHNTKFKFENHDLPLRAVSNYKTDELERIFDILEIDRSTAKKYKKADYYQDIMVRCGFAASV